MLTRLVLSVVVGIVTAIVIYLLGVVLIEVDAESVGNFFKNVAGILGLLAGIWYFFVGNNSRHI